MERENQNRGKKCEKEEGDVTARRKGGEKTGRRRKGRKDREGRKEY